jgi:UDP-N-acetylmuramyl pentapeptide phosphotransferase/UDP-N-acetylglucosamine-1-phosphate transferase
MKYFVEAKEPITTIPFVKTHEFNYSKLLPASLRDYTWLLYILIVIFIITAVSNGSNITDGLDGLATGTSAIIGICLGVFAYASGSLLFADYLNIMYIPNLGELSIFIGAMVGACVGFLWYNSYPAQVFMGDTGSLMLGGIIAALAIIVLNIINRIYTFPRLANNKVGIKIASIIIMPPIVGVPFLLCSPANPRSRTDSPICLCFRILIIFFPISVETSKDNKTASSTLNVIKPNNALPGKRISSVLNHSNK